EPPDALVIALPAGYNWVADACEPPESRGKIEEALGRLLRRTVRLRFQRSAEADKPAAAEAPASPGRGDGLAEDPMVRKIVELFDARPIHLEMDDDGPPPGGG